MAELCKKCFLESWQPYMENPELYSEFVDDIVMSEDSEICEGCGVYGPYVHHIGKKLTCEEYDEIAKRIADLFDEIDSRGVTNG